MMRSAHGVLLFVVTSAALATAGTAQGPYRVSPGDSLNIDVIRHPERSATLTVRRDGRITHAATGEIEVTGKTLQELTEILTEALSVDLRNPHVVINLLSREPHFIHVLGEVLQPGPRDVGAEGISVKEALAQAGGLRETADAEAAELHRDGKAPIEIDLKREMLIDAEEGTWLYENDIVRVLPLKQGYVSVIGTAGPPRRLEIDKGDTILDIIAKGGGAGEEADLEHTLLMRASGDIVTIDLEAIQEGRWEGALPQIAAGDFIILPARDPQDFVTILGRVGGTRKLPIDDETGLTLAEVLAASTPFPPDADARHARIIHADGTVTALDLKALDDGTGDQALFAMDMQPDDIVMVPRSYDEVAALGEVASPGIFPLKPDDTLLDLVTQAGGVRGRRGERRVGVLIRRTEGLEDPEVVKVNLNALVAGRAEEYNVALQPDDMLYVPGPKQKWTQKVTELLQPFHLLRSTLRLFSDPLGERNY